MLANTKERALPTHATQSLEDYLVYLKHIALYKFVARYCKGNRVLDLGCGEGYGSDVLASVARVVVAADYAFQAVAHASRKYPHANVAFVVCDAQALPFASSSFDTVVSFEVIEHIPDVPCYLAEIKRMIGSVGNAILSTPNRRMRLLPFQRPWNRFHRREYDDVRLERELGNVFTRVRMLGITATPPILEIEKRRVRQNPFIAYPKMCAQILIPASIYDRLKSLKPHLARTTESRATSTPLPNFSANDFSVSENNLRDCVNLVTLCAQDSSKVIQ